MMNYILVSLMCAAGSALAMPAQGQPGQQGQGGPFGNMLFLMIGFVVIMYFFMIRPESKRRRQKEDMLRNVGVGDKIVTSGGIHGEVKQVKEKTLRIQVDDHTRLEVEKAAVAVVLEKGTATEEKK